jgi:CheY-like chemotaxis protein
MDIAYHQERQMKLEALMRRKKILVVDDCETSLLIEELILMGAHYEILRASSGLQALATACLERPDLILLDAMMPAMSGLEVLKRLRLQPETNRTPVIMISVRGQEELTRQVAFEHGCNDFLSKPVFASLLLTAVNRQLAA